MKTEAIGSGFRAENGDRTVGIQTLFRKAARETRLAGQAHASCSESFGESVHYFERTQIVIERDVFA
jgi:hypothetical protein